jgi:Phage protein D
MIARNTSLDITYEGKNITEDLRPHLKGWTYTDNLSGQSDDLQITLEDRDHLWMGAWYPDHGAKLKATMKRTNWTAEQTTKEHPLGMFEIDEIENSYPPSEVTIKALSVFQSTALKGETKNRSWEKTKLSVIANDVAGGAGMELYYDVENDPEYERKEQTEEEDLPFLQGLCNEAGLALKVSDAQIIIFDESKYEQEDPVATIDFKEFQIKKFRGRGTINDTYRSVRISHHSPKGRVNQEYAYTPPSPPPTGRVLVIRERFDSLAEAERKAKKALRDKNSKAWSVSLTILEDVPLAASQNITLKKFGKYDGKWIITQATHGQSNSGDETSLQLRRCLEGY